MATEVLRQPSEVGVDEAPPGDGRLDRLIRLPGRLPGPALIWYVGLVPAMVVLLSVPSWVVGDLPVGSPEPELVGPSLLTAYFLGLIQLLNGVARAAFRDFRAALGEGPDGERLAAELTTIPDRQAILVMTAAEVIITVGFFSSSTQASRLGVLPGSMQITQLLAWWCATATAALLILHTVRQLRRVSRLHAAATSIDLFDRGPINAFSRLTSATAIGLLLVPLVSVALGTIQQSVAPSAFELAQQVGIVLLAIAAFVLPLRGMHERMSKEKARLQREVHQRLKATITRIHGAVDADELTQADQLNKTLSSLLAEREVIGKLSTWPWSPGTFRGFASAVLLPIVIWFLIRVLERAL